MTWKTSYLVVIIILSVALATPVPENYKTTYTIKINENGSAIWNVEYRTLLAAAEDFNSFDNYSKQLKSVYLPEFRDLMQRSVSEAATSRRMEAMDFEGEARIQSTPTGKYGIVHYSFMWTNFSRLDSRLITGDVFVGGLYLNKDSTLIIQYPPGYSVEEVTPKPDQSRDDLIWYGLRSFNPGEPKIIFTKPAFPWMSAFIVILVIAAGIGVMIFVIKRRKQEIKETEIEIRENPDDRQKIEITQIEMMDVEERILKILKDGGGSLYQSDIGRQLDLPKSSVSAALNELHERKLIQKIKKGRENLIRLV